MATLYVIPNWARDFETTRSREIVNATYFCVQNSFDGRRIRRLQKLDDALTKYGAFHVMCALASKCRYRGVLLDDHGPMGALDIAEKSGFDDCVETFANALEQLSEPIIGLLEKHEIEQADDGSWPLPTNVARWAVSAEERSQLRASARGRKEPDANARRQDKPRATETGNAEPPPREQPRASARGDTRPHATLYRTEQNGTKEPSAVSLEGRQPAPRETTRSHTQPHAAAGNGQPQRLTDIETAKRLICKKILGGKDPARPWSYDAARRLSELCAPPGLPTAEIDLIAWWRSLPKADDVPDLRDRRDPITETSLMNFWGDELDRARHYWKKTNAVANGAGAEPAGWREFFQKKYGTEVRLPERFDDLDADQISEFQTSEKTEVAI